jgi:TRAP-type mannitol/chloroaromatic compound transport system permease small subunit
MPVLLRSLQGFSRLADAIVDTIGRTAAWLVLFVIVALFAQWPLRELVGGGHLLANDFGQIAHAAVFSIGIAYALRWDGHVRLDVFYQRMSARGRAWVDLLGTLLVVLPWTGIVLWFSWKTTVRSVAVFEQFPETWSPGYWMFKVLLIVFATLLLLQAAANIARDVAQLLDRVGATTAPPPGPP